jgi:UDP-N-acetylmuramate: L-alanyl-gamma-D-glutamyl-meso-diaminopimelate ligase
MQQNPQGLCIAAGLASTRVGFQGAAQVIKVVDHQVHAHMHRQCRQGHVHTERIHRVALKTGDRTHLKARTGINQRNLGRFGVITKELDINVGVAGGRATPDGATQVRAKALQALHPAQRQLAQSAQFGGLAIGAKKGDVLLHRQLHLLVIGQRGAGGQSQLLAGTALGRAVFQALFDHQAGGGGGYFFFHRLHFLIVHNSPMHIHILGICGTFMGGLAALAREAGHRVTGCDAGVYPPMSDQLRALGIDLVEGFGAEQMAFKPDMFVVGNVVSRARLATGEPKFALMEAILDAGTPYTSGPQWLSEHVLQGRHVLAVAGTHGKTTTTAMLSWILHSAGLEPGFLVGGVPLNFGVSARLGGNAAGTTGTPFVIEADEYDTAFFDKRSKFVHYRPRTAVLNNLEFDHADIFDDLAAIERQFHHLLRTVPASGRVVVNGLEESLARVLHQGCWSQTRSFGAAVSDFSAIGEPHDFEVLLQGKPVARVRWTLSGVHNQLNALAAMAAAEHVGVSPAQSAAALAHFENVKRRMEVRAQMALPGSGAGSAPVTLYDDFAHHPTAIRTTVNGLRRSVGSARILAVFEPRSNTMKLGAMKAQLPWSLEEADLAFCHSGGLGWDAAAALAPMGERACVADTVDAVVAQLLARVRPGDQILCMSNGGFGGIHQKLVNALQAA